MVEVNEIKVEVVIGVIHREESEFEVVFKKGVREQVELDTPDQVGSRFFITITEFSKNKKIYVLVRVFPSEKDARSSSTLSSTFNAH